MATVGVTGLIPKFLNSPEKRSSFNSSKKLPCQLRRRGVSFWQRRLYSCLQ